MLVNISENIPTITETMTYKSSVFTGTVKPYWKLHNTHEWKSSNNEIFFYQMSSFVAQVSMVL